MNKKKNIVARLREEADNNAGLRSDHYLQAILNEAADEIEYLRQRCEEIDHEWRLTVERSDKR